MQNTKLRQQAILDIIQSTPVYSQEELAIRLKEAGISATQATLSRDLRALRIAKTPGEGYVSPAARSAGPGGADLASGILRIQFSGALAVIRTRPGLANAVAVLLDRQSTGPVIGTIAGDDTILVILRAGASSGEALKALSSILPGIEQHLVL